MATRTSNNRQSTRPVGCFLPLFAKRPPASPALYASARSRFSAQTSPCPCSLPGAKVIGKEAILVSSFRVARGRSPVGAPPAPFFLAGRCMVRRGRHARLAFRAGRRRASDGVLPTSPFAAGCRCAPRAPENPPARRFFVSQEGLPDPRVGEPAAAPPGSEQQQKNPIAEHRLFSGKRKTDRRPPFSNGNRKPPACERAGVGVRGAAYSVGYFSFLTWKRLTAKLLILTSSCSPRARMESLYSSSLSNQRMLSVIWSR